MRPGGPTVDLVAYGHDEKVHMMSTLLGTTLPETNSSHLKMDGWNTFSFPFGARPIFWVGILVSWEPSLKRTNKHRP